MPTDFTNINFPNPNKVTGLTTGVGNIIVGNISGLTERTVGINGQIIIADSTDPSGLKYINHFDYFMAYTTINTNIVLGFTAIPWNVEQRKDTIYTHLPGSASITINSTGDYHIIGDITTSSTAGGRTESTGRILNNGIELIGSRVIMYNRNAAQGATSGTISYIVNLTSGDIITVEAMRLSGLGTIITLANHCRITIRKI